MNIKYMYILDQKHTHFLLELKKSMLSTKH